MVEEQLLRYVKRYPVLYNTRLSQYRDVAARNIAWEEISERLHVSVEDLKERWSKLRNCYTNALKRRQKKSSIALTHTLPWKFEKQMEFLLPFLGTGRKKIKTTSGMEECMGEINLHDNDNDSIKEETFLYYDRPVSATSSPNISPTSSVKGNENYILRDFADVKMANESRKRPADEMDENDYFFMSMSKELKKLPRSDQADIKFQLHKLIYEAEKKMVGRNSL